MALGAQKGYNLDRFMKNSLFLDYYQHLQYGIAYNKLIDLGFVSICCSNDISSPVFNLAWVDKELTERELTSIENEFKNLDRKPSIYFETRGDLSSLRIFLEEKGFKKMWEDSWMFYNGSEIDKSRFRQVKKVISIDDLEVFLKTFDQCYKKDDPQNPYGELGDYLVSAKNCWLVRNESDRVEYFTVFKNDKPVAVSTLTNFAGMGYISNVGSLKEVRGEGFGKLATLYCVERSRENGNTEHCLATEEGLYPNEFYKRIGFATRFTAAGFVKG